MLSMLELQEQCRSNTNVRKTGAPLSWKIPSRSWQEGGFWSSENGFFFFCSSPMFVDLRQWLATGSKDFNHEQTPKVLECLRILNFSYREVSTSIPKWPPPPPSPDGSIVGSILRNGLSILWLSLPLSFKDAGHHGVILNLLSGLSKQFSEFFFLSKHYTN